MSVCTVKDKTATTGAGRVSYRGLLPELPLSSESWVLEARLYFGRALLDVRHLCPPMSVTLGEERGCDVFVASDGLPVGRFPLLRSEDGDVVLTVCRAMTGEVELDGRLWSFETVRESSLAVADPELFGCVRVRLPFGSRAVAHWGGLSLALRFVAPSRRVPASPFSTLDTRFITTLVTSFAAHVTAAVCLLVYPFDAEVLQRRARADATITLYAPDAAPVVPKLPPRPPPPTDRAVVTPSVAAPVDKVAGAGGLRRPGDRRRTPAEILGQFDRVVAQTIDVLSRVPGNGGWRLGPGLLGLIGTTGRDGAKISLAGMGLRGDGPITGGGSGTSRAIGDWPGAPCVGACRAAPSLLGSLRRGAVALAVGLEGPPVVVDSIDRDLVRQVIDKNRLQIRYCYERELQRDHSLEGKVSVKWLIGGTGRVARVIILDSSLGNAAVLRCIEEKIMTWQFPAPAGGGKVEVNYAFVFAANG